MGCSVALTGEEAAEYVGVSWLTLRQTILEHSIPHVRLGTRWKIQVAVLDEHLRRMAETQAGPPMRSCSLLRLAQALGGG